MKKKKIWIVILLLVIFNIHIFFINGKILDFSSREKRLIELYNQKKLLVLTFDDGPTKYTEELVDMLNSKKIHATFFILGEQANKYPEAVKKEFESGNSVCIHSYKHTFFTKISKEQVVEQISKTQDIIFYITGKKSSYIRVPYGQTNNLVNEILSSQNVQNVLWNVDSLDWKYKNCEKTTSHIKQNVTGNDIILMHDILKTSIDSAEQIIDYYQNLGFKFVTIDEFYHIKNIVKNKN